VDANVPAELGNSRRLGSLVLVCQFKRKQLPRRLPCKPSQLLPCWQQLCCSGEAGSLWFRI